MPTYLPTWHAQPSVGLRSFVETGLTTSARLCAGWLAGWVAGSLPRDPFLLDSTASTTRRPPSTVHLLHCNPQKNTVPPFSHPRCDGTIRVPGSQRNRIRPPPPRSPGPDRSPTSERDLASPRPPYRASVHAWCTNACQACRCIPICTSVHTCGLGVVGLGWVSRVVCTYIHTYIHAYMPTQADKVRHGHRPKRWSGLARTRAEPRAFLPPPLSAPCLLFSLVADRVLCGPRLYLCVGILGMGPLGLFRGRWGLTASTHAFPRKDCELLGKGWLRRESFWERALWMWTVVFVGLLVNLSRCENARSLGKVVRLSCRS